MSWCQYDAYPTTFAEFIEAIATPETRVICPEDAVWDANDFAPEGFTRQRFYIKCDQILGRGLTIKNLKLIDTDFKFASESSNDKARLEFWDSLNLINFVASTSSTVTYLPLFVGGDRVTTIDGQTVPSGERTVCINNSQFSGMISYATNGGSAVLGETKTWCCSCNIELIATAGNNHYFTVGKYNEYANFKVATQGFYRFSTSTQLYSWLDLYGEDLTSLLGTKGAQASIFRCSCPITTVEKAEAGYPSVVSVPDPLTVTLPTNSNLIVCTDAELRDENYLHAQGFPIAVSP